MYFRFPTGEQVYMVTSLRGGKAYYIQLSNGMDYRCGLSRQVLPLMPTNLTFEHLY